MEELPKTYDSKENEEKIFKSNPVSVCLSYFLGPNYLTNYFHWWLFIFRKSFPRSFEK